MSFFKTFFLGKNVPNPHYGDTTIQKRIRNIKAIWNNEHHNDIGLEKALRLFLAFSQFFFLGTYIKQVFSKKGVLYHDLSVDFFVIFKVFLPLFVLYFKLYEIKIGGYFIFEIITYWMMLETMLYIPTLIFASDIYGRPRSYQRSMLLLVFNYIEIILNFAVLFSVGQHFNKPFVSFIDPIYFSFITSASIGYGDYHPVTDYGKFLVIFESLVYLSFIVIFVNFFANKVETKGYFKIDEE